MSYAFDIRVYWEDTDAGGIVFYANYLKFFERARTEWLRHLGLEQHALRQQTGGMFVVIDTQVTYHRPAQLDDLLQVSAQCLQKGRASMVIAQQAVRHHPDGSSTLLCEGTIRIGWVHVASMKPERIPTQLLELFS